MKVKSCFFNHLKLLTQLQSHIRRTTKKDAKRVGRAAERSDLTHNAQESTKHHRTERILLGTLLYYETFWQRATRESQMSSCVTHASQQILYMLISLPYWTGRRALRLPNQLSRPRWRGQSSASRQPTFFFAQIWALQGGGTTQLVEYTPYLEGAFKDLQQL